MHGPRTGAGATGLETEQQQTKKTEESDHQSEAVHSPDEDKENLAADVAAAAATAHNGTETNGEAKQVAEELALQSGV
jgi:Na+-transporting methylmalonyl-CoA/oxaloacetate decarboxylase gamma subunit